MDECVELCCRERYVVFRKTEFIISPERRPTLTEANPRDNASAPETFPILDIDSLQLKQILSDFF